MSMSYLEQTTSSIYDIDSLVNSDMDLSNASLNDVTYTYVIRQNRNQFEIQITILNAQE